LVKLFNLSLISLIMLPAKLTCFKGEICVPGGISIMTRRLVILALAATTFAVAPQALTAANADALCPLGNATLRGTYVLQGGGTIVGVGPVTVVGWLTYDGKGSIVKASMTASVNGTISTFPISGPYTVNSDCSGSSEPPGQHYNMVVSPDGKTVNWIQTDPGTVSSGTEVRLTRRLDDD
jgi:hypothetical protein